ncbi:MAG: hypothetical protein JSV56_09020 [Methanomassiliicoccales archaeon]|nr:MAG: hypothetical protein JSV56_09020 [Methanomassiliicoccales archaeon]
MMFYILYHISKRTDYEKRFLLMGIFTFITDYFWVYMYLQTRLVEALAEASEALRELRELSGSDSSSSENPVNTFFLENIETIRIIILISILVFFIGGILLIYYHMWKKSKEVGL